jgi:hypothetical protein
LEGAARSFTIVNGCAYDPEERPIQAVVVESRKRWVKEGQNRVNRPRVWSNGISAFLSSADFYGGIFSNRIRLLALKQP